MKKLFLGILVVMALLALACGSAEVAFAQEVEDPSLTPVADDVVAPLFDPDLSFNTELVIAPFREEGEAKTLAAVSVGLLSIKGGAFEVTALAATDFDGDGLLGPSLDVNIFKTIALFSDSGSVQWVMENVRPTIGIGVLTPTSALFRKFEPVLHLKIINIDL